MQLTNTLNGSTKDEDGHALCDSTYQTTQLEEKDGSEKDMFGLDDGEELTDEEDETTLGDCMSVHRLCSYWCGDIRK
jgi:hypothetical protein